MEPTPPSSEALSQLVTSFEEKFSLLNQLLSLRAHSAEIGEKGFLKQAADVEEIERQVCAIRLAVQEEEMALGTQTILFSLYIFNCWSFVIFFQNSASGEHVLAALEGQNRELNNLLENMPTYLPGVQQGGAKQMGMENLANMQEIEDKENRGTRAKSRKSNKSREPIPLQVFVSEDEFRTIST